MKKRKTTKPRAEFGSRVMAVCHVSFAIGVEANPEGGFQIEAKAIGFHSRKRADEFAYALREAVAAYAAAIGGENMQRAEIEADTPDAAIAAFRSCGATKQ